MNKLAIQLDRRTVTPASPAVEVWQGFFFFTADNRRVLT
jgi:hypothetical protein